MFQNIKTTLVESVQGVSGGVADLTPKLLIAVVFAALGWLFGSAVGKVVRELVAALKPDPWLEKAGVTAFFDRAGYRLDLPGLLGWLAKAFFVIIFLVAAFDILGLETFKSFLAGVLAYLPKVVVAVLVLFVAALVADFTGGVVHGAAKVAGGSAAGFLKILARWSIWVFAILFALGELGVMQQFVYTLFTGFVAMIALAGGIAFGLGGKEAAAEFIANVRSDMRGKHDRQTQTVSSRSFSE